MGDHMEIESVIKILPTDWDKTIFTHLILKWAQKRKKKPDTDLTILRVSELIERHPRWVDAKKALTEAAAEGWFKLVYKDKNAKDETISNVNRPHEEFDYDVL